MSNQITPKMIKAAIDAGKIKLIARDGKLTCKNVDPTTEIVTLERIEVKS